MGKILCLIATALFASAPAAAESAGSTLKDFGLIGTWSNGCGGDRPADAKFIHVIFAAPRSSPPTRTMIVSKGAERTTIYTDIIAVTPVAGDKIRLRLRLTGGDRNGGPLPMINQNPFDQLVSKFGVRISLTAS
jgi:hypothetical protein